MSRRRIGKGYFAPEEQLAQHHVDEDSTIVHAFEEAFSPEQNETGSGFAEPPRGKPLNPELLHKELLGLTAAQLLRLKGYALWRMRGLGAKAAGRSGEDLLSEALTATLAGNRTWGRNVDLFTHLLGAIRSISTRWNEKKEIARHLEHDWTADSARDDLDENAISHLNPERILAAKEDLRQIRRLFSNDPIAAQVVEFLAIGYTQSEIRGELRLSKQQFSAVVKRVRRALRRHHQF